MPRRNWTHLPYNPRLRPLARALRKQGTMGEAMLWPCIKAKALGCEFHRQVPVDNYILDFFCPERMLAIEIDGSSHDHPEAVAEDHIRQSTLERMGIRFLRYKESDVRENLESVVADVADWLLADASGGDPTSP